MSRFDAKVPPSVERMTARSLRIWLPAVKSSSGADVFVNRLAEGLERNGHEPIVQWFPHNLELTPCRLKGAREPRGVDIIHAGTWQGFAFKRKGIPLVITEHHDVMDPSYAPYKTISQNVYHRSLVDRWMRRSFLAANIVTAVSEFTAGVLRETRGISCVAVPNWVDINRFSPAPDKRSTRRDKFKLLFVGNSSRRKGADVLPALADSLGERFVISCTGGLRKSGPGGRNIEYLGSLSTEALIDAYRDSDAVLVPSRYEGFGYSAAEAMACAKPVVGFRCGALQELIRPIEDCTLCEIDDVDGLANTCRALERDPEWAARIGNKGREIIVDHYTENIAVARYLSLYDSMLAGVGSFK